MALPFLYMCTQVGRNSRQGFYVRVQRVQPAETICRSRQLYLKRKQAAEESYQRTFLQTAHVSIAQLDLASCGAAGKDDGHVSGADERISFCQ